MTKTAFGRQGSQVQLLSLRPPQPVEIPTQSQVQTKGLGQCSEDQYTRVPLTKGYFALIDSRDAKSVLTYNWCACVSDSTVYGMRRAMGDDGKRHAIMLHRFILDAPPGTEVDHIDGDGLNNTRANIRVVSRSINALNRHHGKKALGASLVKATGQWRAQITLNGMKLELGRFDTVAEAAAAYERARMRFGRLESKP